MPVSSLGSGLPAIGVARDTAPPSPPIALSNAEAIASTSAAVAGSWPARYTTIRSWRNCRKLAPEASAALNPWSPRSLRSVTSWPAVVDASEERVSASDAPDS